MNVADSNERLLPTWDLDPETFSFSVKKKDRRVLDRYFLLEVIRRTEREWKAEDLSHHVSQCYLKLRLWTFEVLGTTRDNVSQFGKPCFPFSPLTVKGDQQSKHKDRPPPSVREAVTEPGPCRRRISNKPHPASKARVAGLGGDWHGLDRLAVTFPCFSLLGCFFY